MVLSTELHTVLAVGCLLVAYYTGYFFSMKKHIKEGVDYILDFLRTRAYISIRINKEGAQELVTISELVQELQQQQQQRKK